MNFLTTLKDSDMLESPAGVDRSLSRELCYLGQVFPPHLPDTTKESTEQDMDRVVGREVRASTQGFLPT